MLLGFSVENWMSFRDEAVFSMHPTRERQHGHRIPRLGEGGTRVLPVAAIYGGNASGKSNFCEALLFCKDLVTGRFRLDDTIPVRPFMLDDGERERPSRFRFEMLVEDGEDEAVYEFSFAITRTKVLEERLVKVSGSRRLTLYDRQDDNPNFHRSLQDDGFLDFAFQGTRDDMLFLTNAGLQKVNDVSRSIGRFRPVYRWFAHTLRPVMPGLRPGWRQPFLDEGHPLYEQANQILTGLDTGISRLGSEEIRIEESSDGSRFPRRWAREYQHALIDSGRIGESRISPDKDAAFVEKRLVAYHEREDGTEVKFGLPQESDGTRRVIGLLPDLLQLSAAKARKVYVIDELDRSLHTLLTRALIDGYLSTCNEATRSQLVFTTHDVLLMDQQLLRRDEMWVTERDATGSSRLFSFSEYKDVRYDKDIRKSYLQGRLGGIPNILLTSALAGPPVTGEDSGDG